MSLPQLDGPRAAPANGQKADRLIVLVHGYGADGQDLIGLGQAWQQILPSAAFVAPNAPERCAMSPMGFQWFGITRMDPNEMWNGVQAAGPILDAFIDQELERHGLDDSRLALVGFSQGTMLSLHVGLRRAKAPAAIVGYSGALCGEEHLKEQLKARPPILLVHGDADPTVPVGALHVAVQALGANNLTVKWHVSKGVGHGIAPDGLQLGGHFLVDAFAGKLTASP